MKKPHYFYKVSATSDAGREIQNYMNRCQNAEQQALEWAKKHGAEHYYESLDGMAGGVSAVGICRLLRTRRVGQGSFARWSRILFPDGWNRLRKRDECATRCK